MTGVVGQLSPINWGNITSNIFLGFSKHHGDFDNGEFLGGDNFVIGLKNTFEHKGIKASLTPMIGINDLDVKDYDTDKVERITNNFLSEFADINAKLNKKIGTGDENYLNISVESTYGLQRFPEYLSKFTDGALCVYVYMCYYIRGNLIWELYNEIFETITMFFDFCPLSRGSFTLLKGFRATSHARSQ